LYAFFKPPLIGALQIAQMTLCIGASEHRGPVSAIAAIGEAPTPVVDPRNDGRRTGRTLGRRNGDGEFYPAEMQDELWRHLPWRSVSIMRHFALLEGGPFDW
jgi:hypothetical protein